MDRKEALEKMIKERVEMNPDIVKQRLHKIWNYFNKMNNIDKRNLKKNVEDGQRLYRAPVSQYIGGKLLNRPLEQVIYMDDEFFKENPDIAMFQITHEALHGVSLYRNGKKVVFGHYNTTGGSATNPYSALNEATTQMFAEAVEGKRLSENEDYLYYIKNIMRAVTVLFGEEKIADQYLGNNINFENDFNQFSGNKFNYFATEMNNIYNLEHKRRDNNGVLSTKDKEALENYKENINKFVTQLIAKKQEINPNTFNMVEGALQDKILSDKLNPVQQWIKQFMKDYDDVSYNSEFEIREKSEEENIKIIQKSIKEGKLPSNIPNDIYSIARLLKTADAITLEGGEDYLSKFTKIKNVNNVLLNLMASPESKLMHQDAENNRADNTKISRKLTKAEQDKVIINFEKQFGSSYRYLESDSDYEERINNEQSDIEYIAEYVNRYNVGELNDLDIRSKIVNKETGKMETCKIFQLLNAAAILSVGNQNYFETLCKSPEVKGILERMMNSSHIQNVIEDGEQAKKNNPNSKKPLTNGEKMNIDAKKALKSKKEGLKLRDLDDEEIIFSDIIARVQKGSTTLGGFGKEDLALARICCFQRGLKTVQRDFGGNYGLEVIEDSINPQKIKRDTIKARITNLDIKQMKRRIADKIKGINPKEKEDSQNR